jgi:hypothetical protein
MNLAQEQIEAVKKDWWGREGTIGAQGDRVSFDICPICGSAVSQRHHDLHAKWHLDLSE